MEEIKVGEYCRTDTGDIYKMKYFIKEFDYSKTKHSFNIIDLIEVGDLIHLIIPPDEYYNKPIETLWYLQDGMLNNTKNSIELKELQLLGIITKQQLASVEYKLDN